MFHVERVKLFNFLKIYINIANLYVFSDKNSKCTYHKHNDNLPLIIR